MTTSYASMPLLIKMQENFDTASGSVKAKKTATAYTVKSYDTEIFKVDFKSDTIFYNATRYSNTTARLQRLLEKFISDNKFTVRLVTGKNYGFKFEV